MGNQNPLLDPGTNTVERKCLCSLVPVKDDFISLSHSSQTPRSPNGTDNHLLQIRLQSHTCATSATTPTDPTARASRHNHGPNRTTPLAPLARQTYTLTITASLHTAKALPPPLPPQRTPTKDLHPPHPQNPTPHHPPKIRPPPPHPINHNNPRQLPPRNKPPNPHRSILHPLPPPLLHKDRRTINNNPRRPPPRRNKPARLLPFPTHILDLPLPPHRTPKPGFHHPVHTALPTGQYHFRAAGQETQDVDAQFDARSRRFRSNDDLHPAHFSLHRHMHPTTNPPHLPPFKRDNRHTRLLHRRPYNSNHLPAPQYRI